MKKENVIETVQYTDTDRAIKEYVERNNIQLRDPILSENALNIIQKRYLRKDEHGKIMETPKEMFFRVASNIAGAELLFGFDLEYTTSKAIEFYDLMIDLKFLPNSPTLMNAGTPVQQLSACFVLPVEDRMDDIFDSIKNTALIHKSGGGTGFSFSKLRPKNDIVRSTGGSASGPISFMRVFNSATEEVKQGGKRRGANMGLMRVDHPDILEFIRSKEKEGQLNNFNISVGLTGEFMRAVKSGGDYNLINPKDGKVAGKLNAAEVFDEIARYAWKNGEPGVIFLDRINSANTLPGLGEIEATNPCGEQPLLPFESCNLGSINIEKFIDSNGKLDKDELGKTVRLAVRFLDNVIEVNEYPLPEIREMTRANRKIGLGIMGWANALILKGLSYDSDEAIKFAKEVMEFIQEEADKYSILLAKERGAFDNFDKSVFLGNVKYSHGRRNATVTTIAPTGSISMIANTSSGIEPLFDVVYKSRRADTEFFEVNEIFKKVMVEKGLWNDGLPEKVYKEGLDSLGLDKKTRDLFKCAGEISFTRHIEMQAAFQANCENAVSKTINMPNSATVEDVKNCYLTAYKLGCKGLTVYRDGSREEQVLIKGNNDGDRKKSNNGTEQIGVPEHVYEKLGNIRPIDRPKLMSGISAQFKSSCSNFYVTVNGNGRPFEVFTNSVGRGGCHAQTNAIAMLVSLLLRCGVSVDEIVDRLVRVQCQACINNKEKVDVPSCPSAVGEAIKLFIRNKTKDSLNQGSLEEFTKISEVNREKLVGITVCPDCGSKLVFSEGCRGCSNPMCSYHRCG